MIRKPPEPRDYLPPVKKDVNEHAWISKPRACEKCGAELEQTGTKANTFDGSSIFYFRCPKCKTRLTKKVQSPGKKVTIYDTERTLSDLCAKIVKKYQERAQDPDNKWHKMKSTINKKDTSEDASRTKPEAKMDPEERRDWEENQKLHRQAETDLQVYPLCDLDAAGWTWLGQNDKKHPEQKLWDNFIEEIHTCIEQALTAEDFYELITYILLKTTNRFETIQAKVSDIEEWKQPNGFEEWMFNSEFYRPALVNVRKYWQYLADMRLAKSKKRKIGRK